MPSTTRGSILISTANDIGEALVEKLGGVGYSPNEWKEKYNLCGIAPVDSAPALSVLADSAGTGDERGSILIATADAIGAILNKKYNVLRGFKPKEWASACRKMKALEEGSVASSSIASFSDGADTVPLTSCVCNIDANLDGKSAVVCTKAGRNLFNVANYSQIYTDRDGVDSYNYRYMIIQLKPNTTYTVSQNSGEYSGTPIILINNALPVGGANYFDLRKASDTKTYTTDSTGRLYIGSINSYDDVAYARLQVCKVQIEVGSTVHDFEPYKTPETKTADLGRTIYGGSVDIVNGTGTDENGNDFTFEPVKIDSFSGVNNIWNDCGNTAVGYYKAPTPYTRKTATGGIANFSDQRTDLPLTKAIANIAPSIAGKSAVNLVRTGASLANIADVSGSMTNQYFYNIGSDYVLTAGTTYKIAMEVNSTVTPFAVSVGVGDDAYRYDIYNTGINNKNGVVAFEFTVEASHLATWNKLWIRAPRYSAPSEPSTPTTCTFTVKNITLYSTATTYTAELGETVYGGSVDFVSGEVNNEYGYIVFDGSEDENWSDYSSYEGYSINIPTMMSGARQDGACNLLTRSTTSAQGQTNVFWLGVNTNRFYAIGVYNSMGNTLEAFRNFLSNNNMILVYPLATPTESEIPGRVISPIEGVNNYWNDAGGDTEIQYFEDET